MRDPFISEIMLVTFNFPPKGWAFCWGQLLPINQNQALFSLLGTTYGGNGQTTFALPDLRGRVPIGYGSHPLGETAGVESVTLATANMPAHGHPLNLGAISIETRCYSGPANQRTPVGNVPAVEASAVAATYSDATPAQTMGNAIALTPSGTVSTLGGGQPHENRQPLLVLNYCIALVGVFPSQ
jgi:microcystin-dependent protein